MLRDGLINPLEGLFHSNTTSTKVREKSTIDEWERDQTHQLWDNFA